MKQNLGVHLARSAAVQGLLDDAVGDMLERARADAARSARTGHYLASLKTANVAGRRGVRDRFLYSDDPGAKAIEFGQHTLSRNVPGKFILTRAAFGSGYF